MLSRTPIRHGEVLLFPVESVPSGRVERVTNCIVGHSESGHHHVLESDRPFAKIMVANGEFYVDLDAATPLRHHKTHHQHRELTVPAGGWRILKKTEFDVRALPDSEPDPPIKPQALPAPSPTPTSRPRPKAPTRYVRD